MHINKYVYNNFVVYSGMSSFEKAPIHKTFDLIEIALVGNIVELVLYSEMLAYATRNVDCQDRRFVLFNVQLKTNRRICLFRWFDEYFLA